MELSLEGDEPGVPDGMKVDAEGNRLAPAPAGFMSSRGTARYSDVTASPR